MKVAVIALLGLCAAYLIDALAVHFMAQPYGTVRVRRYYAMPLKGGKTEFGDAGFENDSCVHALFAHGGFAPCWYASRQTEKWITQ